MLGVQTSFFNSFTILVCRNKKTYIFVAPSRNGAVAQSVEQWTENPCVGGSIPSRTTKKPADFCWLFWFHNL